MKVIHTHTLAFGFTSWGGIRGFAAAGEREREEGFHQGKQKGEGIYIYT